VSRFLVGAQFGEEVEFFQRGGVAFDPAAGGDFLEQPAHKLAGPRLGPRVGESNVVGLGDAADLSGGVPFKLGHCREFPRLPCQPQAYCPAE